MTPSDGTDDTRDVLTMARLSEAIRELTYAVRWIADTLDHHGSTMSEPGTHIGVRHPAAQPLRGTADKIDALLRVDTTQPKPKP